MAGFVRGVVELDEAAFRSRSASMPSTAWLRSRADALSLPQCLLGLRPVMSWLASDSFSLASGRRRRFLPSDKLGCPPLMVELGRLWVLVSRTRSQTRAKLMRFVATDSSNRWL